MKRVITIECVILLAAAFGPIALASQKGGLPALEKRVQKLEDQVSGLISQVGSLQKTVNALKSAVSSLQNTVAKLGTAVTDLRGQNNWAVIESSANVVRQRGANVTAAKIGTGAYEITFGKKDMTGCAYTATIGDVGKASVPPGFITVAGGVVNNLTDVQVQTFDKDGGPADSSFHLYVSCP